MIHRRQAFHASILLLLMSGLLATAGLSPVLARPSHATPDAVSAQQADTPAGFVSVGAITPRTGHTATLFKVNRVLLTGGNGPDALASAEMFNLSTSRVRPRGAMNAARAEHTATSLPDGHALVIGGEDNGVSLASAELSYANDVQFQTVGSMAQARSRHTATFLPGNTWRVLVVGGVAEGASLSSVEIYNHATESFSAGPSLTYARRGHTATPLVGGKVLIVGGLVSPGVYATTAEIYDPVANTMTPTGSLLTDRTRHTAMRLPDGKVLIAGGIQSGDAVATAELYDPATGLFTATGNLLAGRSRHTATLLESGQVLVVGGDGALGALASAEVYDPERGIFQAIDGLEYARAGHTATALTNGMVLIAGGDDNGVFAVPVEVYVQGQSISDKNPPVSTLTQLPATSLAQFTLTWSGIDYNAGLASYDLEVREGEVGPWMPVLTETTALSTTFAGSHGVSYAFRLRARDLAGNVEPWTEPFDTRTTVDVEGPVGAITINGGALATTSRDVALNLSPTDEFSAITRMRFGDDGQTWQPWYPFNAMGSIYTLPAGDGIKTVYAQFEDAVGNVSTVVSDSIRLDTSAGTPRAVTINDGALSTDTPNVRLRIGAPAGTAEMQLSNDGGFDVATWQPFDTRPAWRLATLGSDTIRRTVYVRTRDLGGNVSVGYSDDITYDPGDFSVYLPLVRR